MLVSAALFVHLASFAAYLGAGFAQQRFMKMSSEAGLLPALRDNYERLAASIVTKIEVPSSIGSILSGIAFIVAQPGYFRQGWFHGKLTVVVLMLVLSHLEMFNARRIVHARESSGEAASADIAARKRKHGLFGTLGTVLFVALLVLVTFVRLRQA